MVSFRTAVVLESATNGIPGVKLWRYARRLQSHRVQELIDDASDDAVRNHANVKLTFWVFIAVEDEQTNNRVF